MRCCSQASPSPSPPLPSWSPGRSFHRGAHHPPRRWSGFPPPDDPRLAPCLLQHPWDQAQVVRRYPCQVRSLDHSWITLDHSCPNPSHSRSNQWLREAGAAEPSPDNLDIVVDFLALVKSLLQKALMTRGDPLSVHCCGRAVQLDPHDHTTLEHSDCAFMVDNEAIYDVGRKTWTSRDRRTPTWPSWSARLCPQLPPPWGSTELNVDLTNSRPTWFPAQDPLPPGHLCPCHPHWELLLHLNLLLCNSLSTLRCYSPVGRSPARPDRTPLCSQLCWQPSLFSPPSSLELLVLNFSFPVQTLPKNFCFNPIVCNFNAQYSDKNWKVLFFPLDTTCLRQF